MEEANRAPFFEAAAHARRVLVQPEVEHRWLEPSVLSEMTVGDLAAHLARAVSTLAGYLEEPEPDAIPRSPADYINTVLGDTLEASADIASVVNASVRARSRTDAEVGHATLLAGWDERIAGLTARLAEEPEGRVLAVAGGVPLTLLDYIATRIVELLVHADDLALSVEVPIDEPPPRATDAALGVLLGIVRSRHGDTAVLRALTRHERTTTDLLRAF